MEAMKEKTVRHCARLLACTNCFFALVAVVLLCIGVVLPRNFTVDELRTGPLVNVGAVHRAFGQGAHPRLGGWHHCDFLWSRYIATTLSLSARDTSAKYPQTRTLMRMVSGCLRWWAPKHARQTTRNSRSCRSKCKF